MQKSALLYLCHSRHCYIVRRDLNEQTHWRTNWIISHQCHMCMLPQRQALFPWLVYHSSNIYADSHMWKLVNWTQVYWTYMYSTGYCTTCTCCTHSPYYYNISNLLISCNLRMPWSHKVMSWFVYVLLCHKNLPSSSTIVTRAVPNTPSMTRLDRFLVGSCVTWRLKNSFPSLLLSW